MDTQATERVLGILMLDTRFPRIPGDVGNPGSYPFPMRKKTVPGATVDRILSGATTELVDAFVEAARELEREGAVAITSSCGFLTPLQPTLAAAVRVPVFLSALLQVPMVRAFVPGRIGILTADASRLTERVLAGVGIDPATPVEIAGLENSPAFRTAILSNGLVLDRDQIEREVTGLAATLVAEHPDLAAFVFECHNLAPYARSVQQATGRPVFDIITLARWVYDAVVAAPFPQAD